MGAEPRSTSGPVGRFAPTPSGPLHAGSLLAALGSYLWTRRRAGRWLLRIDDVDLPRNVSGAAEAIVQALACHGLHWDGPVLYQSQRLEHYEVVLQQLVQTKWAFACSCTRRDLGPEGLRCYPGTCHAGPRHPQRPLCWRFRVVPGLLTFEDALCGTFSLHMGRDAGDFVLRRADGIYTYQLVTVVDDAFQGVSEVVRGCDLLDSTPRQMALQRALALPAVHYAHLPLLNGADGQKLSKQRGAPAIDITTPAQNLCRALRQLRQPCPAALEKAPISQILDHALRHFDPKPLQGCRLAASQSVY